MLKLLKLEWLKVKHYKAFWIFLALYIIGLFSINYIAYQFQKDLRRDFPVELFPYGFPKIWQTISWISSWLLYFPGMLMILIISNEFTFKTHRQNIVDGLSRTEFISAKVLVAVLLAIMTTLVCAINSVVFGLMFGSKPTLDGSIYIMYCFIQSLAYIFFAMILAVLLRRSGLAMGIFFLYGLIFEQLIGGLLSKYVARGIFYYFPLQSTDVLIPPPFAKGVFYRDPPPIEWLIVLSLAYISAYCFFAFRKFQTYDL